MSDNDVFLDSFWLPAAALKLKAPTVRRFAEKGSALDSAARHGAEPSASETEDYSGFKVALRIRPLMPTERAIYESGKLCVEPVEIDGVPAIKLRRQTPSGDIRTEAYRLHNVFGPEASQHDVYDGVVRRCVLSALAGINASVLAYGYGSLRSIAFFRRLESFCM
jgi:Kinesin motor domain